MVPNPFATLNGGGWKRHDDHERWRDSDEEAEHRRLTGRVGGCSWMVLVGNILGFIGIIEGYTEVILG